MNDYWDYDKAGIHKALDTTSDNPFFMDIRRRQGVKAIERSIVYVALPALGAMALAIATDMVHFLITGSAWFLT